MSANKFAKVVDWIVKLATLVLAVPASWGVAGLAFAEVGGWLRVVMQVAAVALLEGVLLSNWVLLDVKRSEVMAAKARYVTTVWIMYGAMLAVAVMHGEGLAGVVFRLAFGMALVGSTWDTLVATWERVSKASQAGISADFWVARHATKLARFEAKERRSAMSRLVLAEIAAREAVGMARIENVKSVELAAVGLSAERGQTDRISYPLTIPPVLETGNGHKKQVVKS